jgi:hypothetical protein
MWKTVPNNGLNSIIELNQLVSYVNQHTQILWDSPLENAAAMKFPTRFCVRASSKHPSWLRIDNKLLPVSTRAQSLPTTMSSA